MDPVTNHINSNSILNHSQERQGKISRKRHVVKSFEAKLREQRTVGEKIADVITWIVGSLPFVVLNAVWFLVWVLWNLGALPGLEPFDPFPFGLLTMIVSLEAIFLSVFVLMSQNRGAKIDKLRSEVDLQINLTAEQEITKILSLLSLLLKQGGVANIDDDPELQHMLKQIDTWEIERKLERDLEEKAK